ncbi:MAG: signal peptidase I [Lachnospiraceae bacterium]|nr:signal peptidase I [Lachnospiraceae bacterium]
MSLYLLGILVLTFLVIQYVGQRTVVHGESMENTLMDGDNLIVDKLTYRFHEPKRFDVIVFPFRKGENTYYIKRVIGVPGDSVYIDDLGDIYINDEKLLEGFGKETILDPGMAGDTVYLGGDEYFVLGDNRNASADSRDPSVGVVKRDDITGRAWLRIYPFDSIGFVKHE